jgi:micrococcal nuclease
MQPTFTYNAVITEIHDGDTITVELDLGFRVTYKTPIRFNGINAPELSTPEGKAARDFLETQIKVGDTVTVKTYKNPTDKYGRWLGDVYSQNPVLSTLKSINQIMIDTGHAVEYHGGAK